MQPIKPIKALLIMTLAGTLAGCGTSGPGTVGGLKRVIGTDLIGAHGATDLDQRKIDRTIVRLCASRVYDKRECARHGE